MPVSSLPTTISPHPPPKSWDSRRGAMASRGGSFTPLSVRGRAWGEEEGGRRRRRKKREILGPVRAAISGKKMERLLSPEPDCRTHLESKQGTVSFFPDVGELQFPAAPGEKHAGNGPASTSGRGMEWEGGRLLLGKVAHPLPPL